MFVAIRCGGLCWERRHGDGGVGAGICREGHTETLSEWALEEKEFNKQRRERQDETQVRGRG